MNKVNDKWNDGDPYEYFMGRWSNILAPKFLNWLHFPDSSQWLEIGCGTGALSEAILHFCEPTNLTSIDPSEEFIKKAKKRVKNNGRILVRTASDLPFENDYPDMIVSGLVLNFFLDIERALSEMKRVLKTNGTIAAYVWNYS